MDNFGFYLPTRLFFGPGSVKKLARARLPKGRGLIVTGGTSTTRLGYVAKVQDALAEAGHETIVYNKVQPNPTIEGVRECAALCRAEQTALTRRLKEPLAEQDADAFVCAAAWLAAAESLRTAARQLAAPLVEDGGFAFWGVKG